MCCFLTSTALGAEQKIDIHQLLAGFDEEQDEIKTQSDEEFRRETADTLKHTVKRGMVYPMAKPDRYDTQLFDLEQK